MDDADRTRLRKRPDIPKRMASRIRAAQNRVVDAVNDIFLQERSEARYREELADFERDPDAFAQRHYPGNGVDSYPVQTRIARLRELFPIIVASQAEKKRAVDDAVEGLAIAESEVLKELAGMRPGTKGRVPWPKPIPSIETLRRVMEKEEREASAKYARQWERQQAEDRASELRDERKLRARQKMEDLQMQKEWREEIAKLSPEEAAEKVKAINDLADALERGEFTVMDLIAHLQDGE
jgi:hypothetical protein